MKRRKYYPNNWDAIKQCPPNYFPAMPYEEFKDWKIFGYQLPSSHFGIVRVEDLQKNTIVEYTYKTEHHTKQRLMKEMQGNMRDRMDKERSKNRKQMKRGGRKRRGF